MKRPILSAMAGLLFIANGLAQSQPIPVDPAVRIGQLEKWIDLLHPSQRRAAGTGQLLHRAEGRLNP